MADYVGLVEAQRFVFGKIKKGQWPLIPKDIDFVSNSYPDGGIEYDTDDDDYSSFYFPRDICDPPPNNGDSHSGPSQNSNGFDPVSDFDKLVNLGKEVTEPKEPTEHLDYLAEKYKATLAPGSKEIDVNPQLPNVNMIETTALTDLVTDNLSPPEITSIIVFAHNGAIFAHASPLGPRDLRSLCTTYGEAYSTYTKNVSAGTLLAINQPNPLSASAVSETSSSNNNVASIIFEMPKQVAVITKIADHVLLAVVGPSQIEENPKPTTNGISSEGNDSDSPHDNHHPTTNGTSSPSPTPLQSSSSNNTPQTSHPDFEPQRHQPHDLQAQYEADHQDSLARFTNLNLSSPSSTLLALESKSVVLGRFLSRKLEELEEPDDF